MQLRSHPHFGWYIAAAIIACIIFVFQPWWIVDDAFISYRYGKNLVEFGQLTWNPGEKPFVEGYTGILLPILASIAYRWGLSIPLFIQILGLLAFIGSFWVFNRFLQHLQIRASLQIIGIAAFLSSPLLYLHSISGLETIFFSLLFMGTLAEISAMGGERWSLRLSLWLLLAALCRPEGYLLIALSLIILILYKRTFYFFKINYLKTVIIAAIPAAVLLIWRYYYYGEWLPNTYFSKRYEGILSFDSIKSFLQFFVYYLLIPIGLALILLLRNGKWKIRFNKPPIAFVLGASFSLIMIFGYFRSNLYMNYASRFFVPLYLPAIVLSLSIADKNWEIQPKLDGIKKHLAKFFIFFSLLCQILLMGWRFKEEWHFLNYYSAIMDEELKPCAQYVAENLPTDAVIVSYMDAGALGFYSDRIIIDFGRLNNHFLAHNNLKPKEVADYFFSLKADAAVFTSESKTQYNYIPEAMEIVNDPRFQEFKLIKQWANSKDFPYFQRLYIRQE